MSYYAIAIFSGLFFGVAAGVAKHFLIWMPYARGKSDNMYGRMAISFFINVAALSTVFLLRGWWPYSFYATIVATAVGLSATSGMLSYFTHRRNK